ncbi:hypothetical protein DUI87_22041 [Hirundo rustica rustica]|uniref:Uncharacterized protein n=1 Tax=Hirundo rustica rustica TaxID=333673 RepID=A0A3M0JS62_HIRRU|nr:hypothetical protein DUI87_22041 [Hirundo rustica rustica]
MSKSSNHKTGNIPVIPNLNSTSCINAQSASPMYRHGPTALGAGEFTQPVANNQDLPINGSWLWSSEAAQELILLAKKVSLSPFSPNPEQSCWDKHRRTHEQAKNFLVFKEMFWFKQNDQSLNLGKAQPIQIKCSTNPRTSKRNSGGALLFCGISQAWIQPSTNWSPSAPAQYKLEPLGSSPVQTGAPQLQPSTNWSPSAPAQYKLEPLDPAQYKLEPLDLAQYKLEPLSSSPAQTGAPRIQPSTNWSPWIQPSTNWSPSDPAQYKLEPSAPAQYKLEPLSSSPVQTGAPWIQPSTNWSPSAPAQYKLEPLSSSPVQTGAPWIQPSTNWSPLDPAQYKLEPLSSSPVQTGAPQLQPSTNWSPSDPAQYKLEPLGSSPVQTGAPRIQPSTNWSPSAPAQYKLEPLGSSPVQTGALGSSPVQTGAPRIQPSTNWSPSAPAQYKLEPLSSSPVQTGRYSPKHLGVRGKGALVWFGTRQPVRIPELDWMTQVDPIQPKLFCDVSLVPGLISRHSSSDRSGAGHSPSMPKDGTRLREGMPLPGILTARRSSSVGTW